jgi:hypothetical protein
LPAFLHRRPASPPSASPEIPVVRLPREPLRAAPESPCTPPPSPVNRRPPARSPSIPSPSPVKPIKIGRLSRAQSVIYLAGGASQVRATTSPPSSAPSLRPSRHLHSNFNTWISAGARFGSSPCPARPVASSRSSCPTPGPLWRNYSAR